MRNLSRYQWRGTSFGAWLYAIARNELAMHYRRQNRFQPLFDRFLSRQNVEQAAVWGQSHDELHLALGQLSLRDQEILRLAYFEELSHAEIGEILDCSSRPEVMVDVFP